MNIFAKVPTKGKPGGHKSAPKGYPEKSKMYADPKNFKYPLDTEKHVRAALSYLSKPKNQEGYSASELKSMFSRIYKRCKDFGIEVEKTKEKESKKASVELMKKIASIAEEFDRNDMQKEAMLLDTILIKIARTMIPDAEVMNPEYRVCKKCGKWKTLLGTEDEHGNIRNHNISPGNKGICTCDLAHKN